MCKHVAATLYGVGSRLDASPELLFVLRNVDHFELISQAVEAGNLDRSLKSKAAAPLAGADLGEIFGIDLDDGSAAPKKRDTVKATVSSAAAKSQRPRATKKPAPVAKQKPVAKNPLPKKSKAKA